ncbi:MAG: FAD-binding protein [Tissierellales bacterium]|nr:FAD-binding protein [Tissierellales bacterium]MBN2827926.1 FAD-binding protein [Tissierellales bacterium]
MRVVDTDVLVVGGGLSGIIAALEAKKENIDVTIVSKSITGRSGNTLVTGAAMACVKKENGDSIDAFEKDISESSKGINDKEMMRFFCAESQSVIEVLSNYGVRFKKNDKDYITKRPPGHSISRSFPTDIAKVPYHNRGLAILQPLLERVIEKQINILDNMMVIRLLKKQNCVIGALAINKKENEDEFVIIKSKVTILAAGGGGNVFSKTNNTRDITGDSYCLALEAGAELRDMEYIQFYPTMMYYPLKVTISNPLFGEGAVLRNIEGEEFMKRYSASDNMATRDCMAQAVYSEIREGKGNPDYVFVDCSALSKDIINEKFLELEKLLKKRKLELNTDLLPVAPAAHFYLGGIKIDQSCQTGINGLLACGEAAWGVHGANRLSGNALTEAVVFGLVAGKKASQLIEDNDVSKCVYEDMQFENEEKIYNYEGHHNLEVLKIQLREIMWEKASIIRNENELLEARSQINQLRHILLNARVTNKSELIKFYEMKNMLLISSMIIEGALLRKESRGAHLRQDYPVVDKQYNGNYIYKLIEGQVQVSFMKNPLN